MKKVILIFSLCLAGTKLFAQTDGEVFTEEKTSGWLKIEAAVMPASRAASRTNTRTVSPKTTSNQKPSVPKPAEVFKKTNSEVNRFKKKKQ